MLTILRLVAFALFLYAPLSWAETVLQRGNGAEPETLDFHKSSGVPEANIQRDLFEGLVTESADGKLQPGVAESWETSADGKTYTFHLRKEVKWSDGSALTAADFTLAATTLAWAALGVALIGGINLIVSFALQFGLAVIAEANND